jgi:ribose transport system substrate-binding protein
VQHGLTFRETGVAVGVERRRHLREREAVGLRRLVIALAVVALGMLAACGGNSADSSNSSANGNDGAYKVGIVQFASSDPYSSSILRGVQTYAKGQGWDASIVDSGGDVSKALTVITNLIQQQVDLIVTATYPPQQLQGGIAQAKAAGIPVVSIIGSGSIPGLVATYQIGKPQGAEIVKQMENDLAGKKVDLLEITYSPGTGCQEEGAELEGWKASTTADIVETSKNEVLIPGQVEAARGIAASWLESHPEVPGLQNVVWACWDDPALGVVAALRAADRHDVLLYGATGESGAIQAIRDGWMEGDAYTDPQQLGTVVGKAIPGFIKAGVDVKTQSFEGPTVSVTKENVEDFVKQYPNAIK